MLLTEFHESVRRLLEQLRQWLPTSPEVAAKHPFAYTTEKLKLYEAILVAVHKLQVRWSEASDDVKSREEWTLVDELLADVPQTTGEVSSKKREAQKANWQLIVALGVAIETVSAAMQDARGAAKKFGARETKETKEAQTWSEKNTAPLAAHAAECELKLRFAGQLHLGGLLRLVQPEHRLQLCAMYVQTMKFARVIELTRSNYANCDAAFVEGCAMLRTKNVSVSDLIRNPDQLRMLFPSMVGSDDWRQMVVRNAQKVGMDTLTGALDVLDLRDVEFRPLIEAARNPDTGKIDAGRIFANIGSLMLRMKPSPSTTAPKSSVGGRGDRTEAKKSGGGGSGGGADKGDGKEQKVEAEDRDVAKGDAEGDEDDYDGEGDAEGDYELEEGDVDDDEDDDEGDGTGDEQEPDKERDEEYDQEYDQEEEDDGEGDAREADKQTAPRARSTASPPLAAPTTEPSSKPKLISRNRTVPVPVTKPVARATPTSSTSSPTSPITASTKTQNTKEVSKHAGLRDSVNSGARGRSVPLTVSASSSPPVSAPRPLPAEKRRPDRVASERPPRSSMASAAVPPSAMPSLSSTTAPSFAQPLYQPYPSQLPPHPYYQTPPPPPQSFAAPSYMYAQAPPTYQNYYTPPPQTHGPVQPQGMVLYTGPHGSYYAPAAPNYGQPPPSDYIHPPTSSAYSRPQSYGYTQSHPSPYASPAYHHMQYPPLTATGGAGGAGGDGGGPTSYPPHDTSVPPRGASSLTPAYGGSVAESGGPPVVSAAATTRPEPQAPAVTKPAVTKSKVPAPKSTTGKSAPPPKRSASSAVGGATRKTATTPSAAGVVQEMVNNRDTASMLDFYDQFSQMFPSGTSARQIQTLMGDGLVMSGIPQSAIDAVFSAAIAREKADRTRTDVALTTIPAATSDAPTTAVATPSASPTNDVTQPPVD